MPPAEPVDVFISYARQDEAFYQELENHLSVLKRNELIKNWSQRELVAGTETQNEIDQRLKQAGVILLLVSSDFLSSDYIWTTEITRAMERHQAGKACVIPILLRSVDWEDAPFGKLQPLPKNCRPIKKWDDPDDAFLDIARGIREAVERLTAQTNYEPPPELTPQEENQQDRVTELITEATILWKEGKLEEAITKCEAAIRLDPCNAYAFSRLGTARKALGDTQASIADFDQAIRLNPDYAIAYNNRGNARDDLGDTQAAIADYDQAIRLNPDYATAYYNRGSARYDLGDYKTAIADFDQAIRLNPDYADAYYNRGSARQALGNKKSAADDFQKAADLYQKQGKTEDYQDALNRKKGLG